MATRSDIQEALKQSMLKKDEIRTGTLRMLLSAITTKEKEPGAKRELSNEDLLSVVATEAKKRRESIEAFQKGGRQELADKEKQELEVLLTYLPEQLSEDEIRQLVKDVVSKLRATGPQDLGKVMGVLAPQIKGKADGALVSRIVKELLS